MQISYVGILYSLYDFLNLGDKTLQQNGLLLDGSGVATASRKSSLHILRLKRLTQRAIYECHFFLKSLQQLRSFGGKLIPAISGYKSASNLSLDPLVSSALGLQLSLPLDFRLTVERFVNDSLNVFYQGVTC